LTALDSSNDEALIQIVNSNNHAFNYFPENCLIVHLLVNKLYTIAIIRLILVRLHYDYILTMMALTLLG